MKAAAGGVLLVAVLALGFLAPRATGANGVPQLVKLSYLPTISNFGPTNAEGVLEFSFAEAYARVDVKNLVPEAGMTYEGWMIAPDGAALRVGELVLSPAGTGTLEAKLTGLTRYDYDLFVITARPAGTAVAAGAVPEQKSIAGRFAVIPDAQANGSGADTRPRALPDTGESADDGLPVQRVVGTATTMAGVLALLWTIQHLRARRAR